MVAEWRRGQAGIHLQHLVTCGLQRLQRQRFMKFSCMTPSTDGLKLLFCMQLQIITLDSGLDLISDSELNLKTPGQWLV
ncbi:hypothetical protein TURU_005511 [Turdus rufiventris]|nr:hypothetical protein TURU_005511 [Turdus rufiventris]